MFNVTCLIKTDIDTVNKCMGQNPYNPETFLQKFKVPAKKWSKICKP